MRRTILTVALAVLAAMPAFGQQALKLNFQDGRVSVDAASVPVRTILTEWARIGGTNVVGADRIVGAPVTVKLVNVTEAQALETILRGVSGYMAAPRNLSASTGPSMYDRILIMATSSAPAAAGAARPAAGAPVFAGNPRSIPNRMQQRPDQQEQEEPEEPDDNPPAPPVFTFPQPGGQPGAFPNAPGVNTGAPQTMTINPAQAAPGQPTFPASVAKPGMVVPAPAPPTQQPPQPVNQPGMIRPPGAN